MKTIIIWDSLAEETKVVPAYLVGKHLAVHKMWYKQGARIPQYQVWTITLVRLGLSFVHCHQGLYKALQFARALSTYPGWADVYKGMKMPAELHVIYSSNGYLA